MLLLLLLLLLPPCLLPVADKGLTGVDLIERGCSVLYVSIDLQIFLSELERRRRTTPLVARRRRPSHRLRGYSSTHYLLIETCASKSHRA